MKSQQASRASRERPLTPDEALRTEEEPARARDREPRANEVLISGPATRAPDLDISKSGDAWSLRLPDGFSWGLTTERGTNARPGSSRRVAAAAGESSRPEGSALTRVPRILGRPQPPTIRRKNGRRVVLDGVIFNSDDRVVFDPRDDYPWRCVGKLLIWNDPNSFFWDPPSAVGSASLIGRNVVLTSSHMIPNQDRWKGIFLPGSFDNRTSFGLFSYVQTWRRYDPWDQGSDLAILKLFEPIGDTLGFFGFRVYDDDWEDGNFWFKVGYAGMLASGNRPNVTGPFPIIDDDDSYGVELEYRADASGGDSGGPVFGFWDDGPYVVGVHSGGEEEFEINWPRIFTVLNNVAAGGPALADLGHWGRNNW